MTARERVKKALAHQRPDRIPRYEIFLDGYVTSWLRAKGESDRARIHDDYPKIDIGTVLATQEGPFTGGASTQEMGGNEYHVRDSWGRLRRHVHGATFFQVLDTAIKEPKDLDRLEFEDPNDPDRYARLNSYEKEIRNRFAPVCGVMGLFMPCWYLRGETEFLMDLVTDTGFCRALIDRVATFLTVVGVNALACTDTWDTAIWVYDDFGTNDAPLMAPSLFEELFLPAYKRMIGHWKQNGAQNVILHFDGNCVPFIDMFLEAGFTGIQGIYPTTGMTIPAIKAKYGKALSLIGGVCNIHVLTKGTHKDIERHVASIVEAGQDGGVIIGAHSIDEDVPVENYGHYCSALDRFDESW